MTQNDLRKKYPYYDQIQRFRLIDDTFMSVVFQDIGCIPPGKISSKSRIKKI